MGILLEERLAAGYTEISSEPNMWTGEIHSTFTVEGIPVDVVTVGHQQQGLIAVKVQSDLIRQQRLRISLQLPHPTE